ncbi:hypothetical protein FQR65_LT05434 [Abscondita terminalis]|nr:hypothetical protein FQR65_LT05434 [Abscondita terminalis]
MVVCRFFLQGNCRYGDLCKFEHQTNGNRNSSHSNTSILRQQNFVPSANTITGTGTNVDINALLQSVANDMISAEKGGQWILSYYTPFKEKSPFPGFDDLSFEEVRWGFYEARLNGTVPQYCQRLESLLQNTAMQMKMLQNPTPEIINTITSIYYTSTPTHIIHSNQNSSSIFAAANQQYFGAQPVQTNSIFGNTQQVFNTSNNMNPRLQQQFHQPFQEQQQFHQHQQPLPLQPLTTPNPHPNIFVNETNTQKSLFQPSPSNTQSSIFGSRENTILPFASKIDEKAYSKRENLTQEDIERFESDTFEFGKIPEKPPTIEMCLN